MWVKEVRKRFAFFFISTDQRIAETTQSISHSVAQSSNNEVTHKTNRPVSVSVNNPSQKSSVYLNTNLFFSIYISHNHLIIQKPIRHLTQ